MKISLSTVCEDKFKYYLSSYYLCRYYYVDTICVDTICVDTICVDTISVDTICADTICVENDQAFIAWFTSTRDRRMKWPGHVCRKASSINALWML